MSNTDEVEARNKQGEEKGVYAHTSTRYMRTSKRTYAYVIPVMVRWALSVSLAEVASGPRVPNTCRLEFSTRRENVD